MRSPLKTAAVLAILAVAGVFGVTWLTAQDDYTAQREAMVNGLVQAGYISDARVIEAMRTVPRHEFVPEGVRGAAYLDTPLPIGYDQTISAPGIVGMMTQALEPGPTDKVLEIGTGSGYQAAVLAKLVAQVYTIEIVEGLANTASERLQRLGYANVTVRWGDGYLGWEEHAPFDAVIVTCAPEEVPQPLVDQLRVGGLMVIPVGEQDQVQKLLRIEKTEAGLEQIELADVLFVPMTHAGGEDQPEE